MVGLLNIYTDVNLEYSWRRLSEIVAKTQVSGKNHVQRIRKWILDFLKQSDLPLHKLSQKWGTIVDDEDIAKELRTHLAERAKHVFLKAKNVMEVIASPKMQEVFTLREISKQLISSRMALHWLEWMGWSFGKLKNGLYLDGHERADVVEYRLGFVEHWMGHERQFHWWDNDGTELPHPNGFPVAGAIGHFHLILVTHNEFTFFQNNEHNTGWSHATSKSKPKAKGNSQLLMVSDFLTSEWGRLRNGDEWVLSSLLSIISPIFTSTREAQIIFKAGKN